MNKLPIDRAQFDLAKAELLKINPCLDAISILVADNCFTDDDKKRLADFQSWLSSHASTSQDVYDSGQFQYENRPQALISACFRKHESNQKEIALLNLRSKNLIDRHNEKVVELQKKNFSVHEISQILPYPEAEIRANAAKLASLTSESKSLWAFANDTPRFDPALLVGVELGYHLESEKYNLSKRAVA